MLKPEYNTARYAYSTRKVKPGDKTRSLMKLAYKSRFERTQMGQTPGFPVIITDIIQNTSVGYNSLRLAAKAINVNYQTIRNNSGFVLAQRYIAKVNCLDPAVSTGSRTVSPCKLSRYAEVRTVSSGLKQDVLKFRKYSNCAKFLGITLAALK